MLNMNFNERVVIYTESLDWSGSPGAGVCRKRLAREEAERGHATSIVRYGPGARFPFHDHPLGEEILVLDGVFSDASGDYPAGTYLRNPPGFQHAPFSVDGCIILVKLHQFQTDDNRRVCIDTNTAQWLPGQKNLQVLPLYELKSEAVALVSWPANACLGAHSHPGGEEIFVISGEFSDELGNYPAGTWLRNPPASRHSPTVKTDTLIWVKTGHLQPNAA